MTLFYDPCGPLVYYTGNTLGIEDLNPECKMRWRVSRRELFMFGLRAMWAAIRGARA